MASIQGMYKQGRRAAILSHRRQLAEGLADVLGLVFGHGEQLAAAVVVVVVVRGRGRHEELATKDLSGP